MNARNIRLKIHDGVRTIEKTDGVKGLRKAIEGLSEKGWVSFTVTRKVGNITYETLYIYDKRLESICNSIKYEGRSWQVFPIVEFENIPEVKPAPKAQPKRFAWDSERRCIVGVY